MRFEIVFLCILIYACACTSPRITNPCTLKALYSLKYFHEYPDDSKKYLQCDPWGLMTVNECPVGTEWDTQSCYCKNLDELGNSNWHFAEIYGDKNFCSYFGKNSCANGGVCSQFDDGQRCMCFSGYIGDFCETRHKSTGAFAKVMNVFYNDYGMSTSVSLKKSLNGAIFMDGLPMNKFERYVSMYTYGQISFDTLVTYLVEDFLDFIYPRGLRLHDFSKVKSYETGFYDATKSLLLDMKYFNDRLRQFFMIYEDILHNLSLFLRDSLPSIGKEIHSFYDTYYLLSVKLGGLATYSTNPNDYGVDKSQNFTISREIFMEKVRIDVDQILESIYLFHNQQFQLHNQFAQKYYTDAITQVEMRKQMSNFTTSSMTLDRLREIKFSGMELWYEMYFYGFSYLLEELTGYSIIKAKVEPQHMMDEFERESKKIIVDTY